MELLGSRLEYSVSTLPLPRPSSPCCRMLHSKCILISSFPLIHIMEGQGRGLFLIQHFYKHIVSRGTVC